VVSETNSIDTIGIGDTLQIGPARALSVVITPNTTVGGTLAVNSTAANALDVAGGINAGTLNAFQVSTGGA